MTKNLAVLLAVSVLIVTSAGCTRRYTITLNNGNRITTHGKPELKNGYYVFKDATDKQTVIPAGRVREVAPAGMASSRSSSGFIAAPSK